MLNIYLLFMNIKYATLKILILLAYSDKQFHENEKKMIIKISKKNDLPINDMDNIENEINNSSKSFTALCLETIKIIDNEIDRKNTLSLLAQLSVADHIFHEDEVHTLELISEHWGMYANSLREYK